MSVESVRRRRSYPSVTAEAPSHTELLPMVEAAANAADHGSLRPWRLIELRGKGRSRLGQAFVEASGLTGSDATKLAEKPLRAPLLIAIVAVLQASETVPEWEQDAAASGVAHMLSLLLDEAGWGVMWRTGAHVRSNPVRRMHELADNEKLMGWLYVGGVPEKAKPEKKQRLDAERYLTAL